MSTLLKVCEDGQKTSKVLFLITSWAVNIKIIKINHLMKTNYRHQHFMIYWLTFCLIIGACFLSQFIREELQVENGYEKQRAFHGNDKHITVDELWRAWKVSEVHNWTLEETLEWLKNSVKLPQYADLFTQNQIDGTTLPRFADKFFGFGFWQSNADWPLNALIPLHIFKNAYFILFLDSQIVNL